MDSPLNQLICYATIKIVYYYVVNINISLITTPLIIWLYFRLFEELNKTQPLLIQYILTIFTFSMIQATICYITYTLNYPRYINLYLDILSDIVILYLFIYRVIIRISKKATL